MHDAASHDFTDPETQEKQASRISLAIIMQALKDATSVDKSFKCRISELRAKESRDRKSALDFISSERFEELREIACWHFRLPSVQTIRIVLSNFDARGVRLRWIGMESFEVVERGGIDGGLAPQTPEIKPNDSRSAGMLGGGLTEADLN